MTEKPTVVYKRSKSVRDLLVHSKFIDRPFNNQDNLGLLKCLDFRTCFWLQEGKRFCLPNVRTHILKHRVDCETAGVIYLINYTWVAFYVGKTRRQLRHTLQDHLYDIQEGRIYKLVPRHLGLFHKYDPNAVSCRVLEHVPEPLRSGDWDNLILHRESRWIHTLNAMVVPGLNDAVSFKPFS